MRVLPCQNPTQVEAMVLSKAKLDAIQSLRDELGTLTADKWQRAGFLMDRICAISGRTNSLNGRVNPRVCKECGYFGHTKERCSKRLKRLEAQVEDELYREKIRREEVPHQGFLDRKRKAAYMSQAEAFDSLQIPWYKDSEKWYMGAIQLSPGRDGGEGRWVRIDGALTDTQ